MKGSIQVTPYLLIKVDIIYKRKSWTITSTEGTTDNIHASYGDDYPYAEDEDLQKAVGIFKDSVLNLHKH